MPSPQRPLMDARARALPVLVGALLCAPAWADTPLHEALDRAWSRAVVARAAQSRQTQAQVRRETSHSWLAEPPSLGVFEKTDRFNSPRGVRERELELSLPVWLPGLRSARQTLAERDSADADAGVLATRLALAGELRALVWGLALAQAETQIAAQRLASAETLQTEVQRRQQAGDLARTDLLLTQEETLTAQALVREARTRERQALARLHVLTGLEQLPAAIDEAVAEAVGEHPRLALARAAVARAQAELALAREDRRNPPELSLGLLQIRDGFAASNDKAVRMGVRIPLGTEARQAPRLAAANAQLMQAEAQWQQTQVEVDTELGQAQAALADVGAVHQATQARAALAGERLQLLSKAFALGELGLAEFMRVRAAAHAAELEQLRASHALGAARAQLNQARGVLP